MAIKLQKTVEKELIESIQRYFAENMEEPIGDLKASMLLEFCIREIGPNIYNQAITDAQAYLEEKVADLGEARYEPTFDYWKK